MLTLDIAPEILFDTKNGHSFEVDLWSLGVVMYTLLIGKPPFQTKEVKTIYKNIRDNLYDFPENIPILPDARLIITAFLSPKPDERPSVDDVMEHPYFQNRPTSIPLSALSEIPNFGQNLLANLVNTAVVNNWRSPGRPPKQLTPSLPSSPLPGVTTRSRPNSAQAIPTTSTMPPRSPLPIQPAKSSMPPLPLRSPLSAVSTSRSPLPVSTRPPYGINSPTTPQPKKSEQSRSTSWVSAASNPGTPKETVQNENQSPSTRNLKNMGRFQSPVQISSSKRNNNYVERTSSLEEVLKVLKDGLSTEGSMQLLQLQMGQLDNHGFPKI